MCWKVSYKYVINNPNPLAGRESQIYNQQVSESRVLTSFGLYRKAQFVGMWKNSVLAGYQSLGLSWLPLLPPSITPLPGSSLT